jgi:hypothetical protein
VSKVNYANGLKYFSASGIQNHENEMAISHFETLIQTYMNLLSP